ncbi:hypothetical protein KBC75_06290 [Candidatus Shapirobacteria bacterium]|nr:hypothetical protein [Candidatus Shapirobacteria bacterium]
MAIDPLKIAIRGSTQDHLPIEDIVDGLVLMKDGSCCVVMKISSVNFDLLSEREQSALVYAYGGILNSLNFDIQIVIQSSTKDVSFYANNLKIMEAKQMNPLLKERIASYRKFIEEIVKKNDVLSKSFYVVVPFSTIELGIKSMGTHVTGGIPFFGKTQTTKGLPFPREEILDKARASLEPKKEHLVRLFSRLGLEIKQMNTKELIEMFYRIYNEETAANQKIQSLSYDSPVILNKR